MSMIHINVYTFNIIINQIFLRISSFMYFNKKIRIGVILFTKKIIVAIYGVLSYKGLSYHTYQQFYLFIMISYIMIK